MNKKKFKVDMVIYSLFFIFSQIFYLHILGTQGFLALASYLDPNNHGPHIHEQFKLSFSMTNPHELTFRSAFDVAAQAFHWPNRFLGVLTGIGVLITGLILGFIDRIVLFLVLILSFLALLISPVVFIGLVIDGIAKGTLLKAGSNKSLLVLTLSLLLTVSLGIFIYEYADAPHGWRGSLFIAASWLFRDLSFYLNTFLYLGFLLLFDFFILKKILSWTGLKSSGDLSAIHPAASEGFGAQAKAYEQGRPDFPQEAIDYLTQTFEIKTQSKILELGAGTGKFTRLLVPTHADITAVEPVGAMREQFSNVLPQIKILAGTAEAIPAPDASIDVVVVAQAFHWFNYDLALKEIDRVLKPQGKLALIWNIRNESLDWVAQLTRVIEAHAGGTPRYKTLEWKKALDRSDLFIPLEKQTFSYSQKANLEMIVKRVQSTSFIAALPVSTMESVLQQVRELLKSHPQTRGKASIDLPHQTLVYGFVKSK